MTNSHLSRRFRSRVAAVLFFAAPLLLIIFTSARFGAVSAQGGPLFVYPSQATPGAKLTISGPGFPADLPVQIILICDGGIDLPLPEAQADVDGRLETAVDLPIDLPPGDCLIQATDVDGNVAETPFITRPALVIELTPDGGPPGTEVDFHVEGLVEGQMLLLYNGVPVVYPMAVGSGGTSGKFTVPNNAPDSPDDNDKVEAVNLRGGRTVGRGSADFVAADAPPPTFYEVTGVRYSLDGVNLGDTFAINGQITPTPDGPPGSFHVVPVWRKHDGRVFPINNSPAQIAPGGSFTVQAHLPSLFSGDPDIAEAGDTLGIMLFNMTSDTFAHEELPNLDLLFPPLKIKVVDATTKQPITGAMVSFVPWGGTAGAGELDEVANSVLAIPNNQLSGAVDQGLTEAEQWQILMEKAMCIPQPIPIQNPLELIDPTIDFTLLEPGFGSLIQGATQIVNGAGLREGDTHNQRLHYLLTVDAIQQGYGQVSGNSLKVYGRRIDYDPSTLTYYDAETGAAVPNPHTVELNKAPTGVLTLGQPVLVGFEGVLPLANGDPNKPAFGYYYSLLNLPNTQIPNNTFAKVKVHLWPQQYNKIDAGGVKVYLDGQLVGTMAFNFQTGILCDMFKGYQGQGPSYYVGTLTLPNLHKKPPGKHTVRLSGKVKTGQSFDFYYELQIQALPAKWFELPSQGPRQAIWKPGGVELWANWLTATADTKVLNTEATDAETKETGALYNRTMPNASIRFEAKASGYTGGKPATTIRGEVINKKSGCKSFGFAPPPCAVTAQAADDQVIGIPQTTEVVVPEVTYNIPGFAAGIPLVAYVVAGGKISYQGLLTYEGQLTVKNDLSVESEITITPWAEIVGGLWIHDYIGAGILHTGKVELDVGLHVGMPITYKTNSGTDTGDMCFRYFSNLYWYSGEICDPTGIIGGCVVEDYDTEHLFDGYKPKGCTLPPKPALSDELQTASDELVEAPQQPAADSPPLLGTDLASNDFGTIMAVWQYNRQTIAAATYDGLGWGAAEFIPAGQGAHDPQVAFTNPNEAVAVWTETYLPDGIPPGLSVEDAIRARRIAAAVWNGQAWSEALPLTEPSLGEGGVALAGCPFWRPECVEGGKAAVAVWERVESEDMAAREIRLYTAYFTGGEWSSPVPLLPDGPETDILPQVAFLNGAPVVAWVRDGDHDMATANSRRVALLLPGAAAPSLPGALPVGIGEISLAVDQNGALLLAFTRAANNGAVLFSNQRPLWLARGVCGRTGCTWQAKQLFDPLGRPLFAEHPVLNINSQNQAVITFRGTGFGGSLGPQPLDSPGMASGFGDLAQVTVSWPTTTVVPNYLTADAAVNWLPAAVYDPVLDNTLAMATFGAPPVGLPQTRAMPPRPERQASPMPDLPVRTAATPTMADLAVVEVVPASPYILPSDPPRITVRLQNSGAPLPDEPGPDVVVLATWDGGPGVGAFAAQETLNGLGAGQSAELEMVLAFPPGAGVLDHKLTVTVNPWLSIPEIDTTDNSDTIPLGGVPAPQALAARGRAGGSLVFLEWPPVSDERVAGYRVYRQDDGRTWRPVGSAFGPGWVDLNAAPGRSYRYAVAAFTGLGFESARDATAEVGVPPMPETPPRLLFLPAITR